MLDSPVARRNAWLDSGYTFYVRAWRFWTICAHFLRCAVLTLNGEVCSVDASVFSLVAQLALGKLDTTFTSFTWL